MTYDSTIGHFVGIYVESKSEIISKLIKERHMTITHTVIVKYLGKWKLAEIPEEELFGTKSIKPERFYIEVTNATGFIASRKGGKRYNFAINAKREANRLGYNCLGIYEDGKIFIIPGTTEIPVVMAENINGFWYMIPNPNLSLDTRKEYFQKYRKWVTELKYAKKFESPEEVIKTAIGHGWIYSGTSDNLFRLSERKK